MEKQVKRIILARPAVEAGEKLGFLPGDLEEKVNPYLRPLYDALHDMMDFEKAEQLHGARDHRGRPARLHARPHAQRRFIILDEAQNTTAEQMKMFLTRLASTPRRWSPATSPRSTCRQPPSGPERGDRAAFERSRGSRFATSPRWTWCATRWCSRSSGLRRRAAAQAVRPGRS